MSTKLKTPLAILSYPHLDVPQPGENGKAPQYSCALIFTPDVLASKEEKAFLDAMRTALSDAAKAKFGDKAAALWKSEGFKKGLRADAEAKGYPAGSFFINVRSKNQPGLVFPWAAPGSAKPANVPQDQIKTVFYPGAIVRASVSAFAYDNSGNKGVSFGLNNIQWIRDGERLDGRIAAEDDFEADLNAKPASLEDLE